MTDSPPAEVVLPADDLDATIVFFTETLGFRLDAVFPADDPAVAVVTGHHLRIRLDSETDIGSGLVRIPYQDPAEVPAAGARLTAPNGTRIEFVPADPPVVIPPLVPGFALTSGGASHQGRAGMRYRDLIPDQQGGRFIASHIVVPQAGPVNDYVHYHRVRFQVICCVRGWVKVVYEDQGPPFVLEPGDCVLQPPEIRHRVLESSEGLEVVEVTCPAAHETLTDPDLTLPTSSLNPDRDFGGQRFIRHHADNTAWTPWRAAGYSCRAAGIATATDGLAEVRSVRREEALGPPGSLHHDAELAFLFVLKGSAQLHAGPHGSHRLSPGDSFVVPGGTDHDLSEPSPELEMLEVILPAAGELDPRS